MNLSEIVRLEIKQLTCFSHGWIRERNPSSLVSCKNTFSNSNGCCMHGCTSFISDACVTCRLLSFMLRNSQIYAPTMACIQKCSLKDANILFYFSLKFKFVPEFWDFSYLNHSFLECKAWCWKINFGPNHGFPPSYHFVLKTKHFTCPFLLLPNITTSNIFHINLLHLARARAMKIAHFRS